MSWPGLIPIRPGLPVAADRAVDDARIDRGDRGMADAEPVDDTRAEALDDHVGPLRQAEERVAARAGLEVE